LGKSAKADNLIQQLHKGDYIDEAQISFHYISEKELELSVGYIERTVCPAWQFHQTVNSEVWMFEAERATFNGIEQEENNLVGYRDFFLF
jgi:hypothetical protein